MRVSDCNNSLDVGISVLGAQGRDLGTLQTNALLCPPPSPSLHPSPPLPPPTSTIVDQQYGIGDLQAVDPGSRPYNDLSSQRFGEQMGNTGSPIRCSGSSSQRLCEQMGDTESPIHSLFTGQGPSSFCEQMGDTESPIHIPSCILPTTPQWVSLARGGALLPWVPGDILDASVRVAAGDTKGWCMHETAEWLLASLGTSQHHQQYAHLLLSCDGSAPNGACHESESKAAWSVVVGAFETTADDFYQRDGGIVCLGAISDICSSMDHGVPEDNILAEAMAMLFALLIVASRPWVVSAEILLDCDPIRLMLQRSAMLDVLGPFGELVVGAYHFAPASKRITIRHTHMPTKDSHGTSWPTLWPKLQL